jgi:hypothetical protein
MKINFFPETILAERPGSRNWETKPESTPGKVSPSDSGLSPLPAREEVRPSRRVSLQSSGRLTLFDLLKRSPGIPADNALLGVCEDSLPVLFDFTDTALGSLLAVASNPTAAFELLGALVFSTAALNSARRKQVLVISSRPDVWREHPNLDWANRSFLGIYGSYERDGEIAIMRAAEWARQGQLGQRRGPQVLLILDDLAACTEMDFDARLNLEWLLREGPAAGIRPAAAVPGEALLDIAAWVAAFNTCLLGEMEDRRAYRTFNLLDAGQEFPVLDEYGFASRTGEGWFVFRTVKV